MFNDEEINQLKSINSANEKSTYELFLNIDTEIKACENLIYFADYR